MEYLSRKGSYLYTTIVLLLFLATSCIELREEFRLNDKGGGTYAIKVDVGDAAVLINLFGKSYLTDFEKEFKNITQKSYNILKEQKGISDIKIKQDNGRGEYSYQFDFESSSDFRTPDLSQKSSSRF